MRRKRLPMRPRTLRTGYACANQLVDALAGVLPLERCHELATLREDGNRDQRFTGVQARKAVQGAKRLWLARDTTALRQPACPQLCALTLKTTARQRTRAEERLTDVLLGLRSPSDGSGSG